MDLVVASGGAPAEEPVSLDDARLHLGVDDQSLNGRIQSWITAARQWCEDYSGRTFVTTTYDWKITTFRDAGLQLPKAPVQSISQITYVDSNGATQTVAGSVYRLLSAGSERSRPKIVLEHAQTWPSPRGDEEGITVTFVAGYGARSAVPEIYKQAILLLAGHFYENREDTVIEALRTIPMGVKDLLSQNRIIPV